ncbi:MAG: VCBS repeat-containing protein [Planctomycetota bacterium]
MAREHLSVFLNAGGGAFPVNPSWQSADIDYHGRLDVGDVNGDGWPDVAVSVFLGAGGFGTPGYVKLYLNNQGTLSSVPSWTSTDQFNTFSCAFGDVDNDGDLDLVAAGGDPYQSGPAPSRIYFNQGGTLQTTPGWISSVVDNALDAIWCDVDLDGDLDLVTAGVFGPSHLYRNTGGVLATTPAWSSTDGVATNYAIKLACGDIDGDGLPDLFASNNSQFGGAGTFRCYRNLGGTFTTTPSWESSQFHQGYSDSVALLDFDLDGDLDLVVTGWWTPTAVFRNSGGTFPLSPTWESADTAVGDDLFFGDANGDGLRVTTGESKAVNGSRKLFGFAHGPVQSLQQVVADGVPVPPTGYAFHRERGELTLAQAPQNSLLVSYTWSEGVDIGVPGWESTEGTYVYNRDPLFKITLTPPPFAAYQAGGTIVWTETLANTAANWQPVLYQSELEFPNAILTFVMRQGAVVMPPALVLANWPQYINVPSPMPAALLGTYHYRVRASGPTGTVMSSGSYTVQLY